MKKLLFAVVLMVAISGLALAQDFPKYEIFGGYSYLRSDLDNSKDLNLGTSGMYRDEMAPGLNSAGNLNGFDLQLAYNLNSWLGIKADFSYHFGNHDFNATIPYSRFTPDSDVIGTIQQTGSMKVKDYAYLFGPQFTYRKHAKLQPYAHALFGLSKLKMRDIYLNIDDTWSVTTYGETTTYGFDRQVGRVIGSAARTSFAMALGGGLDVVLNDRISIRAVQIDYLPTYHQMAIDGVIAITEYGEAGTIPALTASGTETNAGRFLVPADRFNNLRLATGVVVKF